jgi:hypothetical protein
MLNVSGLTNTPRECTSEHTACHVCRLLIIVDSENTREERFRCRSGISLFSGGYVGVDNLFYHFRIRNLTDARERTRARPIFDCEFLCAPHPSNPSRTVMVPFSSELLLAGAAPRQQDTGADTAKPLAIETAAPETAASFEI